MLPLPVAHLSILLPFSQVCLKYYEYEFMELACQCPAVVCCRCTPTQKAQIVRLLQERTGKLTCAVGGSSSSFYALVLLTNVSGPGSVSIFIVCHLTYNFHPGGWELKWFFFMNYFKWLNTLVWFPLSKRAGNSVRCWQQQWNNKVVRRYFS